MWRQEEAYDDLQGILTWKMLQNGQYFAALPAEGLYDLVMEATRNQELARQMALARATARQCQGAAP